MGKLDKLFGLASKALGDKGTPTGGPAAGGSDWRGMVRKAADALTGDGQDDRRPTHTPPPARGTGYVPGQSAYENRAQPASATPPSSATDAADRAAIARYDYLLHTADPHQIEQVHHEAFARLSASQRAQVEARMRTDLPPAEQPRSSEPGDLARAGARAEAMRPGFLSGLLARAGGSGRGRSSLAMAGVGAAGRILAAVAGGAIASAVAAPLLEQAAGLGVDFDQLAAGVDLDQLAGGAEGIVGGASEAVSGIGDQVSGFGEQLSNGFDLPGLGGLFDR